MLDFAVSGLYQPMGPVPGGLLRSRLAMEDVGRRPWTTEETDGADGLYRRLFRAARPAPAGGGVRLARLLQRLHVISLQPTI